MNNLTIPHSDKPLAHERKSNGMGSRMMQFSILFLLLAGGTLTGNYAKPSSVAALSPLELVNQIGGSVTAVAVHQNTAYLSGGSKLLIVDVSDTDIPVISGQSQILPGIVNDIAVVTNYLYVTTGGTLEIFDISQPQNPTHVYSVQSSNPDAGFSQIAITQNYAFITSYRNTPQFYVFDISNPDNPKEVASYEGVSRHPSRLSVNGQYLYIANSYNVEIFDISSPQSPQKLNSIPTDGSALDVVVRDGFAYIADNDEGLLIVDISDPFNPINVSELVNTDLID